MRERKHIKIRTDMYDDIKMKIIDRSPRRDLVHYIWSRTIVLAGKVNREGQLYMSKNIPYTIETLAIEFGRECEEVKLAFDLLIELEMVELIENGIYMVKNFVKHQNIKVKEESKSEHKENVQNIKEVKIEEVSEKENIVREKSEPEIQMVEEMKEAEEEKVNLEVAKKDTNIVEQAKMNDDSMVNAQEISPPILLHEEKTNKKRDKSKKKEFEINVIESQDEDEEEIISFYEGDFVLREGEKIIREFTMT